MASLTRGAIWKSVFLLTVLFSVQHEGWFLGRRRVLLKRDTKPSSKCTTATTGWSSWSKCSPFCGVNPKSTRTRLKKDGSGCSKETNERFCSARAGCKHNCDAVNKKCTCWSGYSLIDAKQCGDVDECKSNSGRGPCSQKCQNYPGTYICECNPGYVLSSLTSCTLIDCSTPQFSKCPKSQIKVAGDRNLPLCESIIASCPNGTKYNSQCSLSCPKDNKLALKNPATDWSDYSGFQFQDVSSSIICQKSNKNQAIWQSQLDKYYCRRGNDPPLSITFAGGSVKEALPPGAFVGRLSSNDAQKGQTVIYSVQTYTSLFRCKGSQLETSLVLTWRPRERNLYPVLIRAQDSGSPPMWTEQIFNISVENVNDPPHSIEISRNWVYENASFGTVVGELTAIDDDLGDYRTSNFSWKLLEDKTGNFNITDNKVVVQKELNYDTIKLFYIKVACADEYSSRTIEKIPIYIVNLIDPPTLDLRGDRIAENSKQGTVITQITSRSESSENLYLMITESNPNSTLKFGLSSPTVCERHKNATKFHITCYTNITVSGELDYEETSEYNLQIYVRNNDSSNYIKWNISVENVNERPEKLEINEVGEIREDIASGIDIAFLMISDPDNKHEITQNHICHIVNTAGQGQYFQINTTRNSLQVRENKSLNYEMHQSYLVTVQCADNGEPPLSIKQNFTINVTDTDEPIQNMTLSNNKVKENSQIGQTIGILDAYDPDIHRPMTKTFSLVHPKHSPFSLRGVNNDTLIVNGALNFEGNPDYVITIRVTDALGRYLQMLFIIRIEDEHEAPTDIELYKEFMYENEPPGSFISNITMIDEDQNTVTKCTLLEDGGSRVALNGTTLLAGKTSANYEKEFSHLVRISLKCCDQSELCISKDFNISIKDVNEPPTDITIDNLQVSENEKDITIGKVTIFDPDYTSDYHCTITANNQTQQPYLEIINRNKTLRLVRELDFEKEQIMMFEMACTENNSISFTKQFDLTITDVNEAPNSGCKTPLFVSQEQSFGSVIGRLNVTDPDNINTEDVCRPKQKLTYTVVSEDSPFKIVDGYVFKSGHVDANATYIIQVFVQDDGVILAKKFTRINVKKKSIVFNCTVISRPLIGSQIMLSSNEITEGSRNASMIGYLEMNIKEKQNMEYELMKDQCNSYPFVIEGNKLLLMFSERRSYERYTIPRYVLVMVGAKYTNSTSSGYATETQFAISIKDDVKARKLICFSNDPVRLSDIANTKLGPVIIYHDNNTELVCPSKDEHHPRPPVYHCDITPNITASSKDFSDVNFTNALSIDKDMFLRIKISVSEVVKGLDKLVLDLRCFQPDRLFLLVEGSIEVTIAFEGVCENDIQPRNDSLCEASKSCPKDSLCTKVVNAEKRCVPHDDQLIVILPATQEEREICNFESCLQKTLRDPDNICLSNWNNEGREKRATDNPLYIDTMKITHLEKQKRILLSIAVWKTNDEGKLTLVPRDSLPSLQDTGDVKFISNEEKCRWLKVEGIKCDEDEEGNVGKRSSTPSDLNWKAAVGTGAGIAMIVILIVSVYCCRKRRRKTERNTTVENMVNRAFDSTEELPPIPQETDDIRNNEEKGKAGYNFSNLAYQDPSDIQLDDLHIYNEAGPAIAVGTYEKPEQEAGKPDGKSTATESFSSPFYEASDVIMVQKPPDDGDEGRYTTLPYSNEKISTATKEPEYETLPYLGKEKVEKKGWFRFSSKKRGSNQDAGQGKKEMAVDYSVVNKNKQVREGEVKNDDATKEPHYEEVPLPDDSQIEKWQLSLADSKPGNGSKKTKDEEIQNTTEVSRKPSVKKESKHEFCKESAYEDVPEIQEERKRKGLFRFSKAFKNNDMKEPQQENKTDRKNSTNSESTACVSQNEMLNARDRVRKNDPASKYPFYAEVPPVRDSKRTESSVGEGSNQSIQKGDEKPSVPYYHVLEGNNEDAASGDKDVHTGHSYFVLEQSDSGKDKNLYQSLHRELESPQPTHIYERYRKPEKSVSNEADV